MRSQPDYGEIEAGSNLNDNVTVEIYEDHAGGRRRIWQRCEACERCMCGKAVAKSPEQLCKEDEAEDRGLSDRDLIDRSDQLAQGAGVDPSDRDAKEDEPCSLPV